MKRWFSTWILAAAVIIWCGLAPSAFSKPDQKGLDSALLDAARFSDRQRIQSLLSRGASVNASDEDGNTPLIHAVWTDVSAPYPDTLAVIKLLLSCEPNINAQNKRGFSALILAAMTGKTEATKLLIQRGAQINTRDSDGDTALMHACYSSGEGVANASPAIVEYLLNHGADVNAKNDDGHTALIYASKLWHDPQTDPPARHGDSTEITKMLLAKGADVNARTHNGNTALKWAKVNGHTEVVRLLRRISGSATNKP